MTGNDQRYCAIEQRVYVPVPVERVWDAFADPDIFGLWWGGTLAAPLAVGTTATLLHQGHSYTFDVDEIQPPTLLGWRWHPGERNATVDYAHEPKTHVLFEIQPFHEGSLIIITETGFGALASRPQAYADNVNGWLHQAMALARHFST